VPGQVDAEAIVIHANHREMVRYASKEDSGYRTISDCLQIMAGEAPEAIRLLWVAERKADEGKYT
jgi:hypothetical protein